MTLIIAHVSGIMLADRQVCFADDQVCEVKEQKICKSDAGWIFGFAGDNCRILLEAVRKEVDTLMSAREATRGNEHAEGLLVCQGEIVRVVSGQTVRLKGDWGAIGTGSTAALGFATAAPGDPMEVIQRAADYASAVDPWTGMRPHDILTLEV